MRSRAAYLLDLGSGSGLPSVLIACVLPDIPVYAVEFKSRKTRPSSVRTANRLRIGSEGDRVGVLHSVDAEREGAEPRLVLRRQPRDCEGLQAAQ